MSAPTSSTSAEVCEDFHCFSADDFLDVLNPGNGFWQPTPPIWIFRGHTCASWPLLPKAHRPGMDFSAYGVDVPAPSRPRSWVEWRALESGLMSRFHRALDEAGLPVPTEHPSLGREGPEILYASDTPNSALPLLALAQHFGLPTRLLDWTRHAAKAAYFAAEGTIGIASQEPLAVWALRTDLLEDLNAASGGTLIRVVTAPAATNPNLHAQSALFTHSRGGDVIAVEDFVSTTCVTASTLSTKPPFPWLRKITLERSEAPRLLRLLSYVGINGSSMFPGYDGVVRRLKEEAHWR